MSRGLRLRAPAKVNWTLEVLRIRPDGYHEVRSVMQTIDLADTVTLSRSSRIELTVTGEASHLEDAPVEDNLAWRAAEVFRRRARVRRGVRIELEKRIPVAAGLGGGSSDAAAVLRGCNVFWDAGQPDDNLVEIAGELGSDPPFFVVGGTASVRGRGEIVRALPDAIAPPLLLATPPAGGSAHKTAAMYAALHPAHFSDGYVTIGLEDAVEAHRAIVDDQLNNVFERVTTAVQPETERAMDALRARGCTPRLAGAGPSFFILLAPPLDAEDQRRALESRIRQLGFQPHVVRALPRAESHRIERH